MEVIDTAYSGCLKDFNTVVVAVVDVAIMKDTVVEDTVVDDTVVEDDVVKNFVVDLKITKITIKYNVRC